MKTHRSTLFVTLSISAYALALCWFAYSYLNGWVDRTLFFNADALYLPSIFKNLFQEGKHLSDWMLAPSSNIFPDALLYAFAYASSNQPGIQILVFAILQSIGFFISSSILLNCFLRHTEAVAYSALTSASIITLGLYFSDPYGISFISVFHFGSIIAYLLLTTVFLKFLEAKTARTKYTLGTLAIILITLSAISDHLIALHFAAPIFLLGLILHLGKTDPKAVLQFCGLLFIGFLLALALEELLLPNLGRLDYSLGLGSISQKAKLLADWVMNKPIFTQLALLTAPISFIASAIFLARNRKTTAPFITNQELFAYLFLASTVLTLLITGFSNRDFTIRYLLPYIFIPPILLFSLLKERDRGILALFLFLLSFSVVFSTPSKKSESVQAYREAAHCIDAQAKRHGVSRGIAQYWDAIPAYVFSDTNLSVAPVLSDTSPSRWMFNTRDYSGKFSFAILGHEDENFNRLFRGAITKQLTKKPFEYTCFDKTVLIFDNQSISLPQQSVVSNRRSSILESFVNNPRSLLIMAQEEANKGNQEASARLISEAIALLKRSGAREETVHLYESALESFTRKPD